MINLIKDNYQLHSYSFISPEGLTYEGENVTEFAKQHNLTSASLLSLRAGRIKQHKGWTCRRL